MAAGCDLIAASGGDGTINEVIGGIAGSDATLLALPAGTSNVLAGLADLPTRPDLAAALLPELAPFEVPLGRVRTEGDGAAERLFLLMCGVGVDAGIIYHLDTRLKAYLGEGAYWLGSLDQLHRKLEPFGIRIDGKSHEATFALISKSRFYGGGLMITPNAELLAEEFEVAIFHGRSPCAMSRIWHNWRPGASTASLTSPFVGPSESNCRRWIHRRCTLRSTVSWQGVFRRWWKSPRRRSSSCCRAILPKKVLLTHPSVPSRKWRFSGSLSRFCRSPHAVDT